MKVELPEPMIANSPPPVPRSFHRDARQTWHQRRRHAAVLAMLRQVKGNVLDHGCGYGDLTYAISKTHDVRGVDADPARVAFARSEYHPLEFDLCPPDHTGFPDSSFDIVTSVVVLNFVPDATDYVRRVRRLLRPHGHLILACKAPPCVWNWFRRCAGRAPAPSRLWPRSRDEIRALLESEKFCILDETYFFDPPFAGWKNPADVMIGSVEQLLSLFRVGSAAGYFVLLARRVEAGFESSQIP
jgi:SAM-dependent methyltransferase